MNRPAYRFVGLLDGRRTVGDIWTSCAQTMGDEAPTQGEAIQLLGQLFSSNLLSTGSMSGGVWEGNGPEDGALTPDAEAMFRRQRRRATLETQGRMASFLSLRIPLYDPDRLLGVLARLFGWFFSPWGMALWLVVLGVGLAALAGQWGELIRASMQALSPANLPWLYVAFVLAKLVHEAAHGIACKVFGEREGAGGEVHAVGIMLLVLLPAPYVDATSAWSLRSKWRRIIVGAAGMMAELALAALAAIVWSRAGEGTVVSAIAANVIFIAGVSTLLFNGNPLLRYDGYYILSDLLEIPNLQQRSREYLKGLVKKYAWGVRLRTQPVRTVAERWLLGGFGIASISYLLFVTAAITLYVADQWFFIGVLLAVAAACLWFVAPIIKLVRYVATDPELERTRPRAAWSLCLLVVTVFVLVGLVPAPRSVRIAGVAESESWVEVRMPADGFVSWVAPAGSHLGRNAPLLAAANPETEAERTILSARLDGLEARRRQALVERHAEAAIESERIAAVESQWQRAQERSAALSMQAPIAGVWTPDDAAPPIGRFVARGERLGIMVDAHRVVLRGVAGQNTAAALLGASIGEVQARVAGRPDSAVVCRIDRIIEAGRKDLPSESMGVSAGGELVERAGGRPGEAGERFFEVVLHLIDPVAGFENGFLPGQRIVARIRLDAEPIGTQLIRWVRQTVQRRFGM